MASETIAATAVISYFNAAVEHEYLGQWSDAKSMYEMAQRLVSLANSTPGAREQMEYKIVKALQVVNMKVRNKV